MSREGMGNRGELSHDDVEVKLTRAALGKGRLPNYTGTESGDFIAIHHSKQWILFSFQGAFGRVIVPDSAGQDNCAADDSEPISFSADFPPNTLDGRQLYIKREFNSRQTLVDLTGYRFDNPAPEPAPEILRKAVDWFCDRIESF